MKLPVLALAAVLLPGCDADTVYWGTAPSITIRGPHHLVGEVRNGSDLDGDGVDDLLVGAQLDYRWTGDLRVGSVWSGRTRRKLFDLVGEGDLRGKSTVSLVDDVDGDGVVDLAAGCGGTVWIYSGSSGARLRSFRGGPECATLGAALAAVSDLDGDGLADLAVGDPGGCTDSGAVHLISIADGSELGILVGGPAEDRFGQTVCALGDVDGDDVTDLAVGAPGSARGSPGAVSAYSTALRARLYRFVPPGFDERGVGNELGQALDLNGDGVNELVVRGSSRSYLLSGADGSLMSSAPAPTDTLIGDWDGDGIPERVQRVACYESRPFDEHVYARVQVQSTRSGALLVDVGFPHPFPSFEALPDYDGDGVADLFVDAGREGLVYGSRDMP